MLNILGRQARVGVQRRLLAACSPCNLTYELSASETGLLTPLDSPSVSHANPRDRTAEASGSNAEGGLYQNYGPAAFAKGAFSLAAAALYREYSTGSILASPASPPAGSRQDVKPYGHAARPLWNWPNAISGARLLSGPVVAYLIIDASWNAAFVTLALSGISDWLDGYVARRFHQGSVIGSYLDPLADKVLICCTAGALAYEGSLYVPLAGLIIGRDLFLVTGACVHRAKSLGWKWPGWSEFFRTTSSTVQPIFTSERASTRAEGPQAQTDASAKSSSAENQLRAKQQQGRTSGSSSQIPARPAPFVEPLYISKVNTVAQLSLIAGCITSSWYAWPPEAVLLGLGGVTGGLTIASGISYWRQYRTGSLHAVKR